MTNPYIDTIDMLLRNTLTSFRDNETTNMPTPYMFQNKTALESIYLPNAVGAIPNYAFDGCTSLEEVDLHDATSVGNYAFRNCSSLTEVDLHSATSIGTDAFRNCTSLDGCDFSNVQTIGGGGFWNASLKNCLINPVSVGNNGMRDVKNCTIRFFERLSSIGGYGLILGGFQAGEPIVLPSLTSFTGTYAMSYSNYSIVDIGPFLETLARTCFYNDGNLTTLILRRSSTIVALADNGSAFTNTRFASGGTGGTIYIPKVLYDELGTGSSLDYKAATNWSTIDGYGTITWAQIEGSQYENYYADGTPIPEVEEE